MRTADHLPTILVVEDDLLNRKLFQAILEKRGNFAVRFSEDPQEILEWAKQKKMQAIIMDVALSNSVYQGEPMDGLRIARLLKENPDTRDIPILLATAHAMKGQGEKFLKVSLADDYLPKPILDPDILIKKIMLLVNA